MGAFSLWQWLVVLAVVLILFARPGKISGIMGDFGKGLKNFKKGVKDGDASDDNDDAEDAVYIAETEEAMPKETPVRAKTTTKKTTTKRKITKKGAKKKYAWSDDEREEIQKEFGDGCKIQRYKGLGEMNAEQLWDTTMKPSDRTLRQVVIDNGVEADRVFSMLMGDEVPPRREFIEKNAVYANIDA